MPEDIDPQDTPTNSLPQVTLRFLLPWTWEVMSDFNEALDLAVGNSGVGEFLFAEVDYGGRYSGARIIGYQGPDAAKLLAVIEATAQAIGYDGKVELLSDDEQSVVRELSFAKKVG